jgi:hypothetical protein
MRQIQNSYILFTKKLFIKRAMVAMSLIFVMNNKFNMRMFIVVVDMIAKDREDFFVNLVR